jgi:hypothetical protein
MATNNAINKVITSVPIANAVPTWDGNINLSAANFFPGFTSTVSAAGTTTLTVSSNKYQLITGSTTQTVVLPNATTCVLGTSFIIANQSTGAVTVQNNTPATLVVLPSLSVIKYTLIANGTAAGTWKIGDDTLITSQQSFTSGSGTYTPPSGLAYIIVEMCGGGGQSGGNAATSANQASIGGAGAPGGYLKFMMTAAQVGASLSYAVGAAGSGAGAGAAGTAGGTTTFGTWSAGGGAGGVAGNVSATSAVVSGATAGSNTVGTGTVIYNFRCISAQSMFYISGSNFVFICSQGGANPLSFSQNMNNPYFALVSTSSSSTVNGYNVYPGRGWGGYSAGVGGNVGGSAGVGPSGATGAIYVTQYLYV